MRTAYITHRDCLKHEMMPEHPECPERLSAIEDRLSAAGVFDFLRYFEAPKATQAQLARAHDASYVRALLAASPAQGLVRIDPDTAMNPHTVDAALRAAGAVILAADKVLDGEVENAFCNVRPAGHHAERGQAMGFCFFNNVAVGTAYVLAEREIERVAIVDFDVHHGNGTEDIFEDEPQVMMCSSYQHPLYPYTGRDTVPGHLINVPLKPGTGGADFREAIQAHWIPELNRFRPQMIFISAGFDAHYEDDMAGLMLTEADYAWVTTRIMEVAEAHCGGRIVSVLEGGYALEALGRSVVAHVRTLMKL